MELSKVETFLSKSALSSLLPHITLSEWQNKKYKKDTLFYCGWSFTSLNLTTYVLVAGWEPDLEAVLIWGFIPNSGHGWVERPFDSFNRDERANTWTSWTIFNNGPLSAEQVNKHLPPNKQITFDPSDSYLNMPNGEKVMM